MNLLNRQITIMRIQLNIEIAQKLKCYFLYIKTQK
nr:MAG TPA: hypothetical protein [Caudoviricetes sp.]